MNKTNFITSGGNFEGGGSLPWVRQSMASAFFYLSVNSDCQSEISIHTFF